MPCEHLYFVVMPSLLVSDHQISSVKLRMRAKRTHEFHGSPNSKIQVGPETAYAEDDFRLPVRPGVKEKLLPLPNSKGWMFHLKLA